MKLWMRVVAFRKPLILVSLVVFGFIAIYEISKQSMCTRTYTVAYVAFSAILTNQALRRAVCKFSLHAVLMPWRQTASNIPASVSRVLQLYDYPERTKTLRGLRSGATRVRTTGIETIFKKSLPY